jgi:hypothetical protein
MVRLVLTLISHAKKGVGDIFQHMLCLTFHQSILGSLLLLSSITFTNFSVKDYDIFLNGIQWECS